ncbi:hypothetical protein ACP4OV_014621 [Aristida adscensionis]
MATQAAAAAAARPPSGSSVATAPWTMLLAPYGKFMRERCSHVAGKSAAETLAAARNSLGEPITACLHLAPPPALSRLRVHVRCSLHSWCRIHYAVAVSAHGGAMLLHISSQAERHPAVTDYFIYNAGAAGGGTGPPSLCLLPSPYGSTRRWRWPDMSSTGLVLRRGGAEAAVAELSSRCWRRRTATTRPRPMRRRRSQIELLLFRSGEWRVKRPQIISRGRDRKGGGGGGLRQPPSWSTEATVPLAGGLLCWVDLHRGVIFSDVFDERPVLRHVPYPAVAAAAAAAAPPCVTARGALQLVDMSSSAQHSGADAIRRWTLKTEAMAWVRESAVGVDSAGISELWALDTYGYGGVARVQLVYPAVETTMNDGRPEESVALAPTQEEEKRERKKKKRRVEDGLATPRRSERATKRNTHVTGPEWLN